MDMLIWLRIFLIIRTVFYAKGLNYYNVDNNLLKTRHSEVDAIQKLKPYRKKIKNNFNELNLLVIRTNKTGSNLLLSKPCINCINYIKKFSKLKGYKISKLYFINIDGELCKMKLK